MTATAGVDIAKSSVAWLIALLFPVLMVLIDKYAWRASLFTLYPIALSILARTGPFWVDRLHVLGASFVVGILYVIIISRSPKSRKAIEDTDADKTRSVLIFTGMALGTVIVMALSGVVSKLYSLENFNS